MIKSIYSEKNQSLLNWLVSVRNDAGYTQRQLAEKLNVHHSIVGKIEIGERRLDVFEYVTYCEALEANPEIGLKLLKS